MNRRLLRRKHDNIAASQFVKNHSHPLLGVYFDNGLILKQFKDQQSSFTFHFIHVTDLYKPPRRRNTLTWIMDLFYGATPVNVTADTSRYLPNLGRMHLLLLRGYLLTKWKKNKTTTSCFNTFLFNEAWVRYNCKMLKN